MLDQAGVESFEQLARLAPEQINQMHYCGDGSKREMIAACVRVLHYMPDWVREICIRASNHIELDSAPIHLEQGNLTLLAGPYSRAESPMLESAIANLYGMRWLICDTPSGKWLYRDSVGYKEVEAEKE